MQRALEAVDPGGSQVADVVFEAAGDRAPSQTPTQTQTPPVRTRRAPSHVPAPLPTRLWDLNTVDLAVACAASAAATVAAFAAVAWARVTATLRRLLPWATESRVVEGRAG